MVESKACVDLPQFINIYSFPQGAVQFLRNAENIRRIKFTATDHDQINIRGCIHFLPCIRAEQDCTFRMILFSSYRTTAKISLCA